MGTGKVPTYRRHKGKPRDRAFVELSGRRHYLGEYGTHESRAKYSQLISEWEGSGRQELVDAEAITVLELCDRFWSYAQSYYRKPVEGVPEGVPTSEQTNYKLAIRPLKDLYGTLPAREFGPLKLKAVRQRLIDQEITRKSLNRMVGRMKSIFRWGASEQLVPVDCYRALETVAGLKRGRSDAKERPPVRPVSDEAIEAIRPHVSAEVWALVQLQLLCGARPGELVDLRPCDIDSTKPVWVYTPPHHKLAYRGQVRAIMLGPRCQAVLEPFLRDLGPGMFVFSPQRAEARRRAKLTAERKTPASCGNVVGSNRVKNPRRAPREKYTVTSYARRIARACELAKIGHWHPHQLRHSAGTRVRQAFGLDAARSVLGHTNVETTQVYAERDLAIALEVAKALG